MSQSEILEAAINLLNKLNNNAQFFISAIELDYTIDGEEIKKEIQLIVKEYENNIR